MFNKYSKIRCKYCDKYLTKNHLSRHIKTSEKCLIYQNHIKDIKTMDPWNN